MDNLPFPKTYLFIGIAAVILAILIAVVVSRCSAAPSGEDASSSASAQQESAQVENQVNADIPEELRWRDTDFAVDPTRTTWNNKDNGRKVVYLTIDDGPSNLTEQYLDLFDKYNCKVTFFVTGHDPNYYHLIHEAYKRGHTIGLHTMSHEYDKIYASEEAYFSDLDQIGQVVKDQIGYVPCFIRFPGGSSNTQANQYSKGLMPKLVTEVNKRGYQYYDWSAATGDGSDLTTEQLIETTKGCNLDTNVVLLAHDSATKQTTLEALPAIIEYYQNLGYTFEAIDRNTWICHHTVYMEEGGEQSSTSAATTADGEATADGEEATEDGTATYEETEEYYAEENAQEA